MKVIRKEILAGAAVAFVVLSLCTIALYVFVTRPRAAQLADISSKLAARQEQLDSLMPDRMQALLAQAEKKRTELSDYMVLSGQQGELSIRLRQLATANRLDGFSAKDMPSAVSNTNADAYTSEQRMRILFNGDFGGFAGFMYAIETNRPVVFVDGFKVAHNTDDATRVNCDIDATVLTESRN
jgi:hypothetical protein